MTEFSLKQCSMLAATQRRKLRLQDAKQFAQGHTAGEADGGITDPWLGWSWGLCVSISQLAPIALTWLALHCGHELHHHFWTFQMLRSSRVKGKQVKIIV